jgi:hypothetical protein
VSHVTQSRDITLRVVDANQRESIGPLRTTEVSEGHATELRTYFLVLAACAASVCLPIWLVRFPPLVDYPNSLARAYILYHSTEEHFNRYYTVSLQPLPYLAMDAVVVPLQVLFDVELAGKIFLTAIVLLFTVGCHRLGYQIHGRPTWLAPCCSLFVTNSLFLWGWVNYIAGIGLYFITFAAWLRARRGWTPGSWAPVAVLTLACYLAHLSAFVFLGVSVVAVSVFDRFTAGRPNKSMMIGFSHLLIPTILYIFIKKNDDIRGAEWGSVVSKLIHTFCLIIEYNIVSSMICTLFLMVPIAVLAIRGRNLRVFWPTFTVGLAFGILFVVHPKSMLGASGVDVRYVPVAIILMVLSLSREITKRAGGVALAIFLGTMAVRQADIWHAWVSMSRQTGAQLNLSGLIPEGSRVLPMADMPEGLGNDKYDRPFVHTSLYLVIYRRCLVPTLFAWRGLSVLTFKVQPEFSDSLPAVTDQEKWQRLLEETDFVWGYQLNKSHTEFLMLRALKVGEQGGVALFQVRKDRGANRSADEAFSATKASGLASAWIPAPDGW